MPVIDTSWLVALFNPEDAHHEQAVRGAGQKGTFFIPHVILGEFLSLTNHREGSRIARRAFKEINAEPAFQVVTGGDLELIEELYLSRTSLSYPDCVAVGVALTSNQSLLSFDKKQTRLFQDRRRRAT